MSHCRIPGHSAFSFVGKLGVALVGRDGDGKGDKVEAAPDGLVD